MRDSNKSQVYWDDRVNKLSRLVEEGEEWFLQEDIRPKLKVSEAYRNSTKQNDLVAALYSSGVGMEEVDSAAKREIEHFFPTFVDQLVAFPEFADRYQGGLDQHYRYLSFAVLTGSRGDRSARLVEGIKYFERPDDGMNIYFEYLGHEPLANTGKQLFWPEAYEPLYRAIAPVTDESERAGFVEAYLNNWLKQMRRDGNPLYSNLNSEHDIYTGYWCWDAAAAVVMMDVDDSTFREHPNYPKDFADWGRGLPST